MPVQPFGLPARPAPRGGRFSSRDTGLPDRRRATDSADRGRQPARMTYYRGGTLPHTVDTIVFADGHPGPYRPDPAESETSTTPPARLRGRGPHHALPVPGRQLVGSASPADQGTRPRSIDIVNRIRPAPPPNSATRPRCGLPARTAQHRRTRGHRRHPGRDLAVHQRSRTR